VNFPDARIAALRNLMRERGLDAYIIPSGDAHASEYVADFWCARKWLSGFTGSAGLLVVTMHESGLWTDGRYFIQAERELAGSEIRLFKMPEAITYQAFLAEKIPQSGRVGFDGRTVTVTSFKTIKDMLRVKNALFSYNEDLVGQIWRNRPPLPCEPAFEHALEFSGQSRAEKLFLVRVRQAHGGSRGVRQAHSESRGQVSAAAHSLEAGQERRGQVPAAARSLESGKERRGQVSAAARSLEAGNDSAYLVTSLDSVAWLTNLRGRDISGLPVVYAFAVVTQTEAHLFIDAKKIAGLHLPEFTIHDYAALPDFLKNFPAKKIFFNPHTTNVLLAESIPTERRAEFKPADEIIPRLKAVKTPHEIGQIKNAFLKEGIAMTKTLSWLESAMAAGSTVTEGDVVRMLQKFRAEQAGYLCDSFDTISAYGANAAEAHYSGGETVLRPEGFLLLDTGGQYLDGTTDTTRTIPLGALTDEMRRDYTLVLKGHIALARAVFPKGTTGTQLDILARLPLWQSGQNYSHGTGHGLGFCLSVHEGPHNISPHHNAVALEPGMLVTNEPALYKPGRYGIRTENVLCVKDAEFENFLCFEVLTLCPIDTRAILPELLTDIEREWIESYNKRVFARLSAEINLPYPQALSR